MRKMILAAAMLSMSAGAMANPASSLSVQNAQARTYATTPVVAEKRKSEVVPILIGLGIVGAVTYLIIDREDDKSDSN